MDIPGLLPDGSISEKTVNATLRGRGQIRDVSGALLAELAALEQRSEEWLERGGDAAGGPTGQRAPSARNGTRPAAAGEARAEEEVK